MRASHREGDAGPRALRAAHRPAGAGGQLRGSPLHGLLSRPGRAPRPLLSSAKPSLTLAAVLHLATSGVSWLGRGRPRPGFARGSPSRPSGAVAAAGQTPERSGAGGAEPAAAERCVCRACLSAYSITRLPPGTEFLRWFLGSAPVKGSSYFRALSISICCPYLQRLALCWLEFQVINVTVTSLLGVLSLLAVPPHRPPLPPPAAIETGRQRQRSVLNLGCPPASGCCMGFPCSACCGFRGLRVDRCRLRRRGLSLAGLGWVGRGCCRFWRAARCSCWILSCFSFFDCAVLGERGSRAWRGGWWGGWMWGKAVHRWLSHIGFACRACQPPFSAAGYCQCCCRYVKCQGKVSDANQAPGVKPPGFQGELSLYSPGLARRKGSVSSPPPMAPVCGAGAG